MGHEAIHTWLLMLAKYQALSRRRQVKQQTQAPFDPTPAADSVIEWILSRERQEALVASIEGLEPGIRIVTIYRYLLDIPILDIAAKLHLSRRQVDNRLSRGRQRLREEWN